MSDVTDDNVSPQPLSYQRVDPREDSTAVQISRNGELLTMILPVKKTASQMAGNSLALAVGVGLMAGLAMLLGNHWNFYDGRVFFAIPATIAAWGASKLFGLGRYGRSPTILNISPAVVEVIAPGPGRPQINTFVRARIADVRIYSISSGIGPITYLEIYTGEETPFVIELPNGAERFTAEANRVAREALGLR